MTKRKLNALIISSVAIFGIAHTQSFESGSRPTAAVLPERGNTTGVSALFQIDRPNTAPFPSDLFTVGDTANVTGRRVSLPHPDCSIFISDCEDIDVINTLDGFGLQTRISVPFDGDIDPTSINSQTVFVIHLATGDLIGINQIVWDVASKSLHVEVDELLDQHSRYAVYATRGLRDIAGVAINPSEEFVRFRRDLNFGQSRNPVLKAYRKSLLDAIAAAEVHGIENNEIIVASVFTTQSITPVMERIRNQIKAAIPQPASFLLGPSNERAVFSRANVSSIVWRQHTRQSPVGFNTVNLDIGALQVVPDSVGIIAHGKYTSPEYRVPDGYIPAIGTLTGTPAVRNHNEIYFSLFLPAGQKPAEGWPVVIFSHGGGSSRHVGANFHASKLASYGLATVAISAPGYGFGPQGILTVNLNNGGSLTIPDGGRGFDQNLDGLIGNAEGSSAAPPRSWTIGERDGNRQAVIDMMQLVRVIQVGVDADGDGTSDLDHSKIYHHGNSIGAMIGTIFMALEPNVEAAVESVPGGMLPEHGRWAPGRRAGIGRELQLRIPSLVNPPGVTHIDGVSIAAPHFNENKPLRDRPAVVNDTPGAMEIQAAFEMLEWGQQSGQSPVVWAPYIRKAPLTGMFPKRVIYQYAVADQNSTGPGSAALLRAGSLIDRVTYYRHDLAFAENPLIPKNPHGVVNSSTNANLLYRSIARGLQDQNGLFFSSDQAMFFLPQPTRFFEFLVEPLGDELNYIP